MLTLKRVGNLGLYSELTSSVVVRCSAVSANFHDDPVRMHDCCIVYCTRVRSRFERLPRFNKMNGVSCQQEVFREHGHNFQAAATVQLGLDRHKFEPGKKLM